MGLPFISRQRKPPWTPRDLFNGCGGIWLDFSDARSMYSDAGATFIANAATIQQMHDKSGNGNTLSQATSGSRPTWDSTGFATFDGTADHLFMSASLDLYNSASGVSTFALVNSSPGTDRRLWAEGRSSDANPIHSLIGADAGTASTLSAQIRNDAGSTIISSNTDILLSAFDGTKRNVGVIDNFTGTNSLTPYLAGVAGTPVNITRSGTMTTDRFTVGALVRTTTANYMAMNLYQLIVIKRILSAYEINKIAAYFGTK